MHAYCVRRKLFHVKRCPIDASGFCQAFRDFGVSDADALMTLVSNSVTRGGMPHQSGVAKNR
jgi:hypothetical protein